MPTITINRLRGFYEEVATFPIGYSNDGVFGIVSGDKNYIRISKGPVNAQEAGIVYDGTDQTAKINSVLAISKLKELVFDSCDATDITVSGTINAQGKKITFRNNNKIIGTCTISNAIIDCNYSDQCFTANTTLSNCDIAGEMLSVKWFGASPDAAASVNRLSIQKAFDNTVANQLNFRSIYIPTGSYSLDGGVILYNWNGTSYGQVAVDIYGDYDFASGTGTILFFTHTDTWGIAIQVGKGCNIKSIAVVGAFQPPDTTGYDWYSLTIDEYITNAVVPARATQYSPYTGIVIDPFRNTNTLPPDGGYPGYNGVAGAPNFYRGIGGGTTQSGSTGITISQVNMSNFVVSFMCSPNGQTKNAEIIQLIDVQVAYCQVGIACSQEQEKANRCDRLMAWYRVHTIFISGKYGLGTPGNWYFKTINIAGQVNRLADSNGVSYYPSYFEDIFGEGLGSIGYIGTKLQTCVKNANIDFSLPDGRGFFDYVIDGNNCLYQNCMLRFYNNGHPIGIKGNNYFDNCYFEVPPYCPSIPLSNQFGLPVFRNCTVDATNMGVSQANIMQPTWLKGVCPYGDVRVIDALQYIGGTWEEIQIDGGELTSREYWANIFNVSGAVVININSSREATVNVGATHINKFKVGNAVVTSTFLMVGLVKSINTGTNDVVLERIGPTITSGNSYTLGCIYPRSIKGNFIGDLTAGSPIITNVVFDKWGLDTATIENTLMEFPQIMNFSFTGNYQNVAKILDYDSGAATITLDLPASINQEGAYIGWGVTKKIVTTYGTLASVANETILTTGSEIKQYSNNGNPPNTYIVTKSGFFNAAAVSDTRQAYYTQIGDVKNIRTAASNTTLAFSDNTLLVDTASGNITVTIDPTLGNFVFVIKRISAGANTLTISPSSGTIDGAASVSLNNQYDTMTIQIDGTNAYITGYTTSLP